MFLLLCKVSRLHNCRGGNQLAPSQALPHVGKRWAGGGHGKATTCIVMRCPTQVWGSENEIGIAASMQ